MTALDIPRLRLHNQRLIGAPFASPEAAVQSLTAVQAQDYPAAKWALGQRVAGCLNQCIEEAFVAGKFLRTHVMRPTWHFVMPEDIRWMLELTAPRVKVAMSYYARASGIDEDTFARSNRAITNALATGDHLTRTEVGNALAAEGITGTAQGIGHMLMRAELDALVCSGAPKGKQQTYALLEQRAPNARKLLRDEALAELARRYFTSHGPALPQDFAWWSGLTVADARTGIEHAKEHLANETVDGKSCWFAPTDSTSSLEDPTVHLLPNYDEYLIAYKERGPALHPAMPSDSRLVYDFLSRHFVVLNGLVVGGWRNLPERQGVVIETRFLVPLTEPQTRALDAAAEAYSRFLGKPVTIRPAA
jgi:hypothetical protein